MDLKSAIIVDDEPLSREALKIELSKFEEIEIIGECSNGFEAIKMIQDKKPDLVFLDIQMPKLTGFDVIELLGEDLPFIVFVTAYDEYALKAFETYAVDYILKPVKFERLQKTIERIDERVQLKYKKAVGKVLKDQQQRQIPVNRILVKDRSQVHIIPVKEVMYFEAQDDYVNIQTIKDSHLKFERLANLDASLDKREFCRIHRSYILNLKFLRKIEAYSKDSKVAILHNGKTLPISRSGYGKLTQVL